MFDKNFLIFVALHLLVGVILFFVFLGPKPWKYMETNNNKK